MPNPLNPLTPLLDLLGREIKILPATGGAVEYLQHPDQDEIEDIIINKDADIITAFAEDPEPDPQNIYRQTPPLPRTQNHLFRFFIDGSVRTYFLGTGIEGTRSFPIELAQIGSVVLLGNAPLKKKTLQVFLPVFLMHTEQLLLVHGMVVWLSGM